MSSPLPWDAPSGLGEPLSPSHLWHEEAWESEIPSICAGSHTLFTAAASSAGVMAIALLAGPPNSAGLEGLPLPTPHLCPSPRQGDLVPW